MQIRRNFVRKAIVRKGGPANMLHGTVCLSLDNTAFGLGSVLGRFWVDLGSIWDRFGVDVGSIWGRFGFNLG